MEIVSPLAKPLALYTFQLTSQLASPCSTRSLRVETVYSKFKVTCSKPITIIFIVYSLLFYNFRNVYRSISSSIDKGPSNFNTDNGQSDLNIEKDYRHTPVNGSQSFDDSADVTVSADHIGKGPSNSNIKKTTDIHPLKVFNLSTAVQTLLYLTALYPLRATFFVGDFPFLTLSVRPSGMESPPTAESVFKRVLINKAGTFLANVESTKYMRSWDS